MQDMARNEMNFNLPSAQSLQRRLDFDLKAPQCLLLVLVSLLSGLAVIGLQAAQSLGSQG